MFDTPMELMKRSLKQDVAWFNVFRPDRTISTDGEKGRDRPDQDQTTQDDRQEDGHDGCCLIHKTDSTWTYFFQMYVARKSTPNSVSGFVQHKNKTFIIIM